MSSKNCTLVKALVVTLLLALAVLWWGGLAGAEAKKAHKDGKDQGVDFYGRPIDLHAARLVRKFNYRADRGEFDDLSVYQFRKKMNDFGLNGMVAHVGHVVSRKKGGRNKGANLMALPTKDNLTLGEKIVPCDMAAYWNRLNVKCERLYVPTDTFSEMF